MLELDTPGVVAHWNHQPATLGSMLVVMLGETAQHAGHADIVRELIDGTVGRPNVRGGNERREEIQQAADLFR